MPRIAIVAVATAALFAVTGCSANPDDDPKSNQTTPSPTVLAEDRFQNMWGESLIILGSLNEITQTGKVPADATAANEALLLNDSDMKFVEYSADADKGSGRLCLTSKDGTFLALEAETEFAFYLGDGTKCSYDGTGSEVVGDLETETWTKGDELMGDRKVADLYATEGTPTPME